DREGPSDEHRGEDRRAHRQGTEAHVPVRDGHVQEQHRRELMKSTGGTSTSTDDVALLQRRLALCGKIGASLAGISFALAYLPFLVHSLPIPKGAVGMHVVGGLVLVGVWTWCRRGARSLASLRVLDVAMVLASVASFGVMTTLFPAFTRPDLLAA